MDLFSLGNAANKLYGNEGKPAQENQENKVLELNVSDISADPCQPRKVFDEDELLSLAGDIERNGLIQPIVVRKDEDHQGKYFVISGERRLKATLLNDSKTIKAILASKDWQQEQIAYIQVSENLKRSDLKFYELADFIISRIDAGEKQVDVSEKLGLSKTEITRFMCWKDASDEVKAAKDKFSSIRAFSDFMKVYETNPEKSLAFLNEKTKMTNSAVTELKKSLEEPKVKEETPAQDEVFEQSETSSENDEASQDNITKQDENGSEVASDTQDTFESDSSSDNNEFNFDNTESSEDATSESESIDNENPFENEESDSNQEVNTPAQDEVFEQGEISSENFETSESENIIENFENDEPQDKFKKPIIWGSVDGREAELLYKKKPTTEGLICVKYEDGFEDEILAEEYKINRICEA